jgi:hypothetical protein
MRQHGRILASGRALCPAHLPDQLLVRLAIDISSTCLTFKVNHQMTDVWITLDGFNLPEMGDEASVPSTNCTLMGAIS